MAKMRFKELKIILDEAAMLGILGKENITLLHCEMVILEVETIHRKEESIIDFLISKNVEYKARLKQNEPSKSLLIIELE